MPQKEHKVTLHTNQDKGEDTNLNKQGRAGKQDIAETNPDNDC